MPLEEIGDFLHNRDTGRIQELLSKQLVQVHKKQQELAVMEHQIKNRLNQIQGALSAHPGEIFLEKKPPLKLACMKKQLNPENYKETVEKPVSCQVTRQGTGWIVTISDLPYQTPVTVNFRCTAQESVNGMEIVNTAQAYAEIGRAHV